MPPRWACLVIVAVWAVFAGLLVRAELLPLFRTGDPPPFTIDLVEEAQTRRPTIDWVVFINGKQTFRARTSVAHPGPDIFEMTAEYRSAVRENEVLYNHVYLTKMTSTYTVTAEGDLLGVRMTVNARKDPAFLGLDRIGIKLLNDPFVGELKGKYVGEEFHVDASLAFADGAELAVPLPRRKMSARASMLQPMHPVNRIGGLRPNQTWTTVMYDPLVETINSTLRLPSDAPVVTARVLPETQMYERRGLSTECHVIEYEGDNLRGRTMVDARRGLVMSQEMTLRDEKIAMHRD